MKIPINSVRFKLFMVLFVLLFCFMMFLWGFNVFFLESAYQRSKIAVLEKSYSQIRQTYKGDIRDVTFAMESLEEHNGVEICIAGYDLTPIYYNMRQTRNYDSELNGSDTNEFGRYDDQQGDLSQLEKMARQGIINRLIGRNLEKFVVDGTLIEKRTDERNELSYLTLYGAGNINGEIVYITVSTSVSTIREGVNIASHFILTVGIILLCIGSVSVFFIAKKITKPIERMNDVMVDIANLKFTSLNIRSTNDELGQLAGNINLVSGELERSINELRTANGMLKEFISNVSHELKTPISIIMGYSEGLMLNINEEEKDYYCRVIIEEAAKMNDHVLHLLDLSRLDAGAEQMKKVAVSLSEILNRCISRKNFLLKDKDVVIRTEGETNLQVFADIKRMEQVLDNYLSNAAEHTDKPGEILVKAALREGRVRISVINRGDPIPDELTDRVWESYYKIDKSRSREYGGTGLGLYIVKSIMTVHNNSFGCYNTGDGVCFWFEMDRAEDL